MRSVQVGHAPIIDTTTLHWSATLSTSLNHQFGAKTGEAQLNHLQHARKHKNMNERTKRVAAIAKTLTEFVESKNGIHKNVHPT
jgi:hypothetical protein